MNVIAGLVDEWKFDEGSGANTADSGPGNHAGVMSGATWTSGLFNGPLSPNGALLFNGTNSKVTFGTGPSLSGTTDFTVSAWIKTTATTSGVIIQQRDLAGFNGEYQLQMTSSGYVNFWVFGNGNYQWGTGTNALTTTGTKVNDGNWHLVTAVRSGVMGYIYVDGTQRASATGTAIRPLANTITVAVGADVRSNPINNYFSGTIDEVRIYSVALSGAQITSTLTDQAPSVAIPASASPSTVFGTTTNLSVLGASNEGQGNLTYTWTASPSSGVTIPTSNGTNAAQNTTVTFSAPGTYTFTVTITDKLNLTATSSVNVTVGASLPAGWSGGDVGSVGVAGWSSSSGNTFTLTGAGGGIGGTADAFQFSSQSLTGDGQIVAQITSLPNTGANAMAGIMIRNDSTAGSANALLALNPNNGFIFQTRGTAGGSTTPNGTAAAYPTNWVKLTRSGTLIAAYVSPDGANWTQFGTATVTMTNSTVNVGLVNTSGVAGTLGTATFSNVTVTPFPAPWQSLDIGSTGQPGSAEYYNGAFTLYGAGSMGLTSDSFHYMYQTLSGDGQLSARISVPQDTGNGMLLGVMIRDQLTPGAMYACMGINGTGNGNGSYTFQYRSNTGGASSTPVTSGNWTASNPSTIWVQIVRSGNTLSGSTSTDGTHWTPVATQTINMGTEIYIGLVNASGSTTTVNSTVFDSLSVTP
jgi:regulation of enolase protein 1 (concanavalin A-like superfamily)